MGNFNSLPSPIPPPPYNHNQHLGLSHYASHTCTMPEHALSMSAPPAPGWDEHLQSLVAVFQRRQVRQNVGTLLPFADACEQVNRAVRTCASVFIDSGLTPENVGEDMIWLAVSKYVHDTCGRFPT